MMHCVRAQCFHIFSLTRTRTTTNLTSTEYCPWMQTRLFFTLYSVLAHLAEYAGSVKPGRESILGGLTMSSGIPGGFL